jgi:hypothetical protein
LFLNHHHEPIAQAAHRDAHKPITSMAFPSATRISQQ